MRKRDVEKVKWASGGDNDESLATSGLSVSPSPPSARLSSRRKQPLN